MKTIGLIGGMSWESTLVYYRVMNEAVKERLGGLHSAKILLYSVDFGPVRERMVAGDWQGVAHELAQAARVLERGGADLLVIGTNTMHKVAPQVAAAVDIPLLHMAEATADAVLARGMSRVGLLGTAFTMEENFYTERLAARGLEVLTPDSAGRKEADRIIFDELCRGTFSDASREKFVRLINEMAARGAEGVVLGCTEIGLLVRPQDTAVPLFDTCLIHAARAVDLSL